LHRLQQVSLKLKANAMKEHTMHVFRQTWSFSLYDSAINILNSILPENKVFEVLAFFV